MEGYFICWLPLLNETEKAYCFSKLSDWLDNNDPTWIPKSQTIKEDEFIYVRNWLFNKLTSKQKDFIWEIESEKDCEMEEEININTKVIDFFDTRIIYGLNVWYLYESDISDIDFIDLKLSDLKEIDLNKLLKYRNIGIKSINKIITVLSKVGVKYKF